MKKRNNRHKGTTIRISKWLKEKEANLVLFLNTRQSTLSTTEKKVLLFAFLISFGTIHISDFVRVYFIHEPTELIPSYDHPTPPVDIGLPDSLNIRFLQDQKRIQKDYK